MRISPRLAWFLGFSAAFSALVGYVFWGTWSPDVAPVMPDSWTTYAPTYLSEHLSGIFATGRLIPDDLKVFLGGPWVWQELQYAFALYFAALGAVYYCRGRGLSRAASYGAGLLLAFSGYWLTLYSAGHLGWFRWMTYGVFAFGLADRAVRLNHARHWVLLGAVVSWAGFNQQDLWLLFSIFTAVYFVWCCLRERRIPVAGALLSLAVFVAIGIPNFASSLGETLEGRKKQIERGENVTSSGASDADKRWEFVTNWSMPPDETVEFLVPRVNGDTSCPFVLSINRGRGVRPYVGALGRPMRAKEGNYRQHSLYVGWATLLLAALGVASAFARRRPQEGESRARGSDAAFFAVAAVVFYMLSLGRYFEPAYRIVFSLPFGDLIRCPVKWHHLTELSLAFLAAYGIDAVLRFASAAGLGRNAALGAVAAVVLMGACGLAANARLYCAPFSVREARRAGLKADMAILRRADFSNPQVAAMVRAGRIVSLASYMGDPDTFLVEVLGPFGKPAERPPRGILMILAGILSMTSLLWVPCLCAFSGAVDSAIPGLGSPGAKLTRQERQ